MKYYKGRVMAIETDVAYVFSNDGRIVRIQKLGDMHLGQPVMFTDNDIVYRKARLPKLWRAYAAVPALLLCLMAGMFQFNAVQVYAALAVDINPSMTLLLNREAKILRIEAHNEDAEDLLATVEPLKGKTAVDAVGTIIKASDALYLTPANDDVFLAATVLKNGFSAEPDRLLDEIVADAEQTVFEEDVSIYTATLNADVYHVSKDENISMTSYVLTHDNAAIPAQDSSESEMQVQTPQASDTALEHANEHASMFIQTKIPRKSNGKKVKDVDDDLQEPLDMNNVRDESSKPDNGKDRDNNGNSQSNVDNHGKGNGQDNADDPANANGQGNANNPANANGQDNADDPANANGQGNANNPANANSQGNADSPANANGQGNANNPANANGQGNANNPANANGQGNADSPANANGQGNTDSPGNGSDNQQKNGQNNTDDLKRESTEEDADSTKHSKGQGEVNGRQENDGERNEKRPDKNADKGNTHNN
ncbi:anti-sigma factor domain-containing protein [Fusibacter paucivorans]|uniref:Anti-sigma factor domain-containing protein n=1 Tax=Fusibacter paucivorans TaxID=76009 RepID=A0ABS5PRE7_9FIRM|nr:anti-sigma factor domain-containing protein [Fusibacter paucivorans]MBS7526637.1 anti-sigma factor domain-containing protein [Fusibacter paucivorans]